MKMPITRSTSFHNKTIANGDTSKLCRFSDVTTLYSESCERNLRFFVKYTTHLVAIAGSHTRQAHVKLSALYTPCLTTLPVAAHFQFKLCQSYRPPIHLWSSDTFTFFSICLSRASCLVFLKTASSLFRS